MSHRAWTGRWSSASLFRWWAANTSDTQHVDWLEQSSHARQVPSSSMYGTLLNVGIFLVLWAFSCCSCLRLLHLNTDLWTAEKVGDQANTQTVEKIRKFCPDRSSWLINQTKFCLKKAESWREKKNAKFSQFFFLWLPWMKVIACKDSRFFLVLRAGKVEQAFMLQPRLWASSQGASEVCHHQLPDCLNPASFSAIGDLHLCLSI